MTTGHYNDSANAILDLYNEDNCTSEQRDEALRLLRIARDKSLMSEKAWDVVSAQPFDWSKDA